MGLGGCVSGYAPIPVKVAVAARHVAVGDLTADGCADWFVADAKGKGAIVRGVCAVAAGPSPAPASPPAPTPAAAPSPAAPAPAPAPAPAAAPAPAPAPAPATESAPADATDTRVRLTANWLTVQATVGERLELDLRSAEGKVAKYAVRGAPPGFEVSDTGRIRWTPTKEAVGEWRIGIRVRDGSSSYGSGIELEVRDGE